MAPNDIYILLLDYMPIEQTTLRKPTQKQVNQDATAIHPTYQCRSMCKWCGKNTELIQSSARAAGVSMQAVGHRERSINGRLESGLSLLLFGALADGSFQIDGLLRTLGDRLGDRPGIWAIQGITFSADMSEWYTKVDPLPSKSNNSLHRS